MIVRFLHNYAVSLGESIGVMGGFKGFEGFERGSRREVRFQRVRATPWNLFEPFRPFVCGNAVDVAVALL